MQGKKRGDGDTAPNQARRALQNQEQQDRISRMEKHVDGVKSRRIQTKHLAVECIRKPCNRVPVQSFRDLKRPYEGMPGEAGSNLGILRHVNRIVVIEKWSPGHRVVEDNRRQRQQKAENHPPLLRDPEKRKRLSRPFERPRIGRLSHWI